MKKLIKTDSSLILVSNEGIKEGELCYLIKANKCIIYSTKWQKEFSYNNSKKVLSQSPKLSKEVADEIGFIDVEELAEQYQGDWGKFEKTEESFIGFIEGFRKAEELNQKKYTGYDIVKAIAFGFGICRKENRAPFDLEQKEFINSLSQPQQYLAEAEEIDGVWFVTKILNK